MQPLVRCNKIEWAVSDIVKALVEVELGGILGGGGGVQRHKSTPVKANAMPLVLTALQITHKRGGKTNHVPAEHGSVCFP